MALIYKPVFRCDFCGKEVSVSEGFDSPQVTISIDIDKESLDPRTNLVSYMEAYLKDGFGSAEGQICYDCKKAVTDRIIYRRTHINDKG